MAIPEINKKVAPLTTLLEHILAQAVRRTKKAAAKISLDGLWTAAHVYAFTQLKQALEQSVTLSNPDDDNILCLFTDASEQHWGGVPTQIPPSDVDNPFQDRHHEPLAFLSLSFKGSSARWSTPQKGAFAMF